MANKQSKLAIVEAKKSVGPGDPIVRDAVKKFVAEHRPLSMEETIKSKKYPVGGVLKEMNDIDASSFNKELLNTDIMAGRNVQAKVKNAQMTGLDETFSQAGAKGATGMKEFQMTRDENAPGIRFDEMLQTVYKNAQRAGVKNQQEFLTSFDSLLNSAKPEDKAFLQKYGGPDSGASPIKTDKFKRAAAEQYQRLLNEREKNNTERAIIKDETTTPTVKLSVKK